MGCAGRFVQAHSAVYPVIHSMILQDRYERYKCLSDERLCAARTDQSCCGAALARENAL